MDSREPVDVIIPTLDNIAQLMACVNSIRMESLWYPVRIIIVNNGESQIEGSLSGCVISPGQNLGWTGGLKEGLKHSSSKYVMFANDDIYVPISSGKYLKHMVRDMDAYPWIGAEGPSSNCVTGSQNIWADLPVQSLSAKFLIGYCMLVRREALDKVGGIHEMQYGGDDIDLSIRLRKAGYILVSKRSEFVYHHGFQTGERIHGKPNQPNGWNSREMIENTNMELIRKHGFLEWWETVVCQQTSETIPSSCDDAEGDVIRKYLNGGIVVELGCGNKKTVPHAIGVDRISLGNDIPYIEGKSTANVVADIQQSLPFDDNFCDSLIARHVFEHCLDPIRTMKNWRRIIKPGGTLIMACPDEKVDDGIPLNPEHLHAFTADTIKNLADATGFEELAREENYNGVSFTSVLKKA